MMEVTRGWWLNPFIHHLQIILIKEFGNSGLWGIEDDGFRSYNTVVLMTGSISKTNPKGPICMHLQEEWTIRGHVQ